MQNKIRAKEARIKYFEEYVTFENEIRRIARKYIHGYKTYGKSLRSIIEDLSNINTRKFLLLPIRDIRAHRLIRNWLAHAHSNSLMAIKSQKLLRQIRELNLQLLSW